jgi:hypothetical protein
MAIENRAKGAFDILIKDNLDIFDEIKFSQDNIEWAIATVDSKILYGKWQAFLLPMLDHITFAESTSDPTKTFSPEIIKEENTESKTIRVFAQNKFSKGNLVTENINMKNEKIILNFNQIITNKKTDCFSISLNFSTNKEDKLAEMRAKFYQKYFLFDSNSQYLM